jgi:methanogenic corrinoid protein MtbC1
LADYEYFQKRSLEVKSMMTSLISAILEGDCEKAVDGVKKLRRGGIAREDIVVNGLESAMSALDAKCTLEQFNLLEIMLAGRAVMAVMKLLYPDGLTTGASRGKIVIAALEGDVHDLGKNILKIVLIGKSYQVIDCGKDCPLSKLIEITQNEKPLAVGISGLITPVISQVRQVKNLLAERQLNHIKVIAGGAALKQSSPERLNVDFVAESAFDCVRYLGEISGAPG